MKFIPAILIRWVNAPSGAKIAPTALAGTSRQMRTKRTKKPSSFFIVKVAWPAKYYTTPAQHLSSKKFNKNQQNWISRFV